MKSQNINRFWFMFIVLALAALACQGGGVVTPTAPNQPNSPQSPGNNNNGLSQSTRSNLISATVQIYGLFDQNGEMKAGYVGSGTIISPTGMILTNAHVASPASQGDTENEPDALSVGIIQSEDRPAVSSYLAEVKAVDGFLDIAVIQIVSTIDGASIDSNSLNLPYVPLGDSDSVHVGDHINIFGFPLIGGATITFTDGSVSGFTAEEQIGDRAWIKTDATFSGGNSGGLAANDNAQIIGIPTIAASGADAAMTDCRVVQDTNGDGQLDDKDTCIPIGGFINGLRPVNLAAPLIKAAQASQTYTSPYNSSVVTESSTGKETMSAITWYLADKNCKPTTPVESYKSGTNMLNATFEFTGFVDAQAWGDIWYQNGEKLYGGNYVWDQGESGGYFTCIQTTDGSPFADGTYHVEIYVDNGGDPLTQADVMIGAGGGASTPSKPNKADGVILYGNIYDADSNNGLANVDVVLLKPGTTYDMWSNNNYPVSDTYSYTQTDSNGNYRMPDAIQRNIEYTLVALAKGYYDQYGDGLIWTDQDPAEYELNIGLSK